MAESAGEVDGLLVFGFTARAPAFPLWANGFLQAGEHHELVFRLTGFLEGFEEPVTKAEHRETVLFLCRDEANTVFRGIEGDLPGEMFGEKQKGLVAVLFVAGEGCLDRFEDLAGEVEIIADSFGEKRADHLEFRDVSGAHSGHRILGVWRSLISSRNSSRFRKALYTDAKRM